MIGSGRIYSHNQTLLLLREFPWSQCRWNMWKIGSKTLQVFSASVYHLLESPPLIFLPSPLIFNPPTLHLPATPPHPFSRYPSPPICHRPPPYKGHFSTEKYLIKTDHVQKSYADCYLELKLNSHILNLIRGHGKLKTCLIIKKFSILLFIFTFSTTITKEIAKINARILKAHSHSMSGDSIWASFECQCCFWIAGGWVVT